ncbi:hypothetical protein E6O75_ATG05428 [Venturia nashicola]|uniref:Zf-C3HC-domain-containing protein n=1 Tax=Venturia nashicola TaxID=86259 RepID=A0A4Z1PGD2_9PEZI|nr:hypothetical protein E6O75_ATG05428 [Venturia nashicola]
MPSSSSSYRLDNSKRKFYDLLDNISSPKINHARTDSTATLAPEQHSKRPRVTPTQTSRPLTAPSSKTRPISANNDRALVRAEPTSTTPSPNGRRRPKSYAPGYTPGKPRLRHKSSAGLALDGAADRELPNYAPWSHDQFLARLKTFADVRTWTPKPMGIGEVEWAKRGWSIAAKDTVGCKGGCGKRLLVRVVKEKKDATGPSEVDDESSWWMGDVELAMVERYKGLIIEAHDDDCLWRKAGCKDDIYRIQQADPSVWQKELKERYAALLTMETALPEVLEMPQQEREKEPFNIDAFAKIVPPTLLDRPHGKENSEPVEGAETTPPISNAINKIALNLALCGWTGQSPNGVNLAYCTKCFQRVGLWLYRIVSSTTPLSSDLEPMTFNPVDLHREHCPWKNIESQCAKGSLEGLSGWQVLVHLVTGYRKHEYMEREREREKEKELAQEREEDVASVHEEQSPRKSRDELRQEDAVKRGRLQRLKRAFTVTKKSKDKV